MTSGIRSQIHVKKNPKRTIFVLVYFGMFVF